MRSVFAAALASAAFLAISACSSGTGSSVPAGPAGGPLSLDAPAGAFRLPSNVRRACEIPKDPELLHCLALVRTDVVGPDISGYGPSDLQSAYGLPSSTNGTGQVVAIVDAFDNPNAESDLGVYRTNFGLPACTTANGCFRKVNQEGQQSNYPPPNSGWAVEMSLDVDMVSAICPNCHIILVESNSNSTQSLGRAVNEAVKLGANAVSNSYIGYGAKGSRGAVYYNHPGVILTAGGGDEAYGVGEPAGFPTVVSVGGTALTRASGGRGWNETVWHGTGSGCENRQAKPSWQTDKGCKGRTMNDVAAVASPGTPVAVYDTYQENGWITLGGTSVATPVIAGVYALAGNESKLNAAESLYAKGASLFDVTSGNNGTCMKAYLCTGEVGYDGPTGNGTPNGISAF